MISLPRSPAPEPGCVDPFAEVYRLHFDFVWRLTRALGVEPGAIDDVVHEVFLVVRRRLDGFARERSMRAWLAGITRNLVMHHRRAHARHARKLAALPEPDPPQRPDDFVARADAAAAMERFLDGLDADKREVFVLMEIERMTAREVEAIVGVNHRTLHTRLRAARLLLAEFIAALDRGGER
ncbi:MAG TPA: sigma-70 family RNA polymerase sigma factor [Nannocystaceae bacterium]|nr:sigma-70 family RNA polymerase sigma factor [Nannocystaceae bacterium]